MACLKLAPSPASALWFKRKSISSPPPECSIDHVWFRWVLRRLPQLRWLVGDPVEGYQKLPGLGSCCCNKCAWTAISNPCHTVTLQPHATFRTFSFGRKENSEEKKILLSNRSGPYPFHIPHRSPKEDWWFGEDHPLCFYRDVLLHTGVHVPFFYAIRYSH